MELTEEEMERYKEWKACVKEAEEIHPTVMGYKELMYCISPELEGWEYDKFYLYENGLEPDGDEFE